MYSNLFLVIIYNVSKVRSMRVNETTYIWFFCNLKINLAKVSMFIYCIIQVITDVNRFDSGLTLQWVTASLVICERGWVGWRHFM